MAETYTFVVPVWCVLLLVASQIVATGFTFWRTLWLRRQVKSIEAEGAPLHRPLRVMAGGQSDESTPRHG